MRLTVRCSMAAVALAAFALSFQSLTELGTFAGYGPLAALYPVCVDLGTVSSCVTWLHTRSRQAFWMTWVLLGISVVQNGTVHWLLATGERPEWWLITLVATVPPATLGLVVHLAVGLGATPLQLREGAEEQRHGGEAPLPSESEGSDPVAELLAAGAGRRKVAEALGVSEHRAKQLIAASRNGHVQ